MTGRFMQRLWVVWVAAAIAGAAAGGARAQETTTTTLEMRDDKNMHLVAVEALVVEINEERTRDLGISYSGNQLTRNPDGTFADGPGILDGVDAVLGRALAPVRVPVLIPGPGGKNIVGFENRLPGFGLNLSGMSVGSGAVSVRLRALLNTGDASIRTRPVAVAMNNTTVLIEAVNEVPVQMVVGGGQLNVSFETVGVKMEVRPSINSLRPAVATLDIAKIEVSAVSSLVTTKNIERPVFTKSTTHTKVTLAEGETFVVGGLKTRRVEHTEERVPILGDIPLLGLLFRSQQDLDRNVDVLFFITPHIMPPGENFLLPFDFKNQRALGLDAEVASE